jgi:flagellar hook-length control protein FliK
MAAALTAAALVAGAPDDDGVPATPSAPMIGSAPAAPAAIVATPKPAAPSPAAVQATPPTAPGPNKSDTKSEARTAKSDPAAATASSAPAQAETSSTGDPTVQTAIAASLARDSNAPKDPASTTNDPATPDTGAAPPGATGAATPPAPALAVAAAAHNGAAAAPHGSAPTAAAVAQAMFNSAEAAVQGKHRDDGPDGNSSPGISNDGSAGAAQLLSANAPTDAAPMPTFKVNAGVDTPDFGQGLADRVSMMMDSNLTSAKLQVNPASLGPIEVRIALQGGHAQVWMSSHSAVTRDALESSAPKLREMLGAQGFGQVSVDISQRSFQDRSPQPQPYEVPAVRSASTGISASPVAMTHTPSGLLDAYA